MEPKDFLAEFDRRQAQQKKYANAFLELREQFENDFNLWMDLKRVRFFTVHEMDGFDAERPDKPVPWPVYLNLRSEGGPEVNLERRVYMFPLSPLRLLIQYPVQGEHPEEHFAYEEPRSHSFVYESEKDNGALFTALMAYFVGALPEDAGARVATLAKENGLAPEQPEEEQKAEENAKNRKESRFRRK